MIQRLLIGVLLCIASVFFVDAAYAGQATLTWAAPTTCADGTSPLTDCPTTGYEVSEGATITSTFAVKESVGATVTSRTYTLPPGQRCFSLKTVSNSLKSDESQRACVTIPSLPPKAPAGVTVVTVQVSVATP